MEKRENKGAVIRRMEWRELLNRDHDFAKTGKALCFYNPPDPKRCDLICSLLEEIHNSKWKGDYYGHIVIRVRNHGLGSGDIPLVTTIVTKEDGAEYEGGLNLYRLEDLIKMKIEVEAEEAESPDRILTAILFYYIYPLRLERQKKRDTAAMFANVLAQVAANKIE